MVGIPPIKMVMNGGWFIIAIPTLCSFWDVHLSYLSLWMVALRVWLQSYECFRAGRGNISKNHVFEIRTVDHGCEFVIARVLDATRQQIHEHVE